MTDLFDWQAFPYVVAGVIVAVVLPVIMGFIRREFPPTAGATPPWVKKYGGLLLFALLTGLVVLAAYRSQHPTGAIPWFTAFLLGFAWESTLEKLTPRKGV
jgi:hypothetical protein